MRATLLALALLLAGCGSISGAVSGSATVDTPAGSVAVSFDLPLGGLRGGLLTVLAVVDPEVTDAQASALLANAAFQSDYTAPLSPSALASLGWIH